MTLRQRVSEELLPYVRQPAQYIGGEWNQLVASGDWERADVRVAVGFPDTYGVGMSHLGSHILYWLCNHMPGVCAERVFAPWRDAEEVMRQRGIPLFTWDTRQPVAGADIFAVSLQYEMAFTNLLMMLDLAGIPLGSVSRTDEHPLVVAGGPQADNPEPVADFLDLVVIGDGEHSMRAIVEACGELKRAGASRLDRIVELARRFEWIYAPSLYAFDHHADGRIAGIRPGARCPAGFAPRERIGRCSTPDFETADVPTRPLVPHTEIVHDRIAIEIMRGCPNRCRFCHAGYTKRPLVCRSVDRILAIAEESHRATGHSEIGLLSLSSADYPELAELARRINERFAGRQVNISLPSLRVERMLADIPWMVNSVRKSGLTLAVEAASPQMRSAIRKTVSREDLLDGVRQAYAAGWNAVKLYFMCGFPGECDEDITGIIHLAREVAEAKRGIRGGPAAVTVSVGWLVPKPHTPLQWAPMQTLDYFKHARGVLRRTLDQYRRSTLRIKAHFMERSILEGVFARGDRRLAPVIETAWRLGARMDGWDEQFDDRIWRRAFEEAGVDPAFYAHRQRASDEIFPWDHVDSGPSREYLHRQYEDFLARAAAPRSSVAI